VIADLTMASRMSAEAFTTDVARSLRAASIARCAVSSGGFASYRRDPLGEAYREGRGLVTNFLYCIETAIAQAMQLRGERLGSGHGDRTGERSRRPRPTVPGAAAGPDARRRFRRSERCCGPPSATSQMKR